MKKYIIVFVVLFASILSLNAQGKADQVFTNVQVVNGKVVFQQFILTDNGLSEDQKYALLYKWGKDNYTGNPLLSGIRFNEQDKSITVSSKVELLLPPNSKGVREKMLMNYRFDASITRAGCMLLVRDITYQNVQGKDSSFFPKAFSAEEMITDTAIASAQGGDKELKVNTQKGTLTFLNELFSSLNSVFEVKK
ncbi:MAG: hypothetical protein PHO94_08310 [Petrimonas sp.]|nr:hypothetical protein [Petrimonas sp.]